MSRGQLLEEADDVLGLAAELGAQLGLLRGDAGGTGIEVALPRHVAAERDEHRGAEGVFVGAEHRGDDDVARGAQAAVAAQAHAAAQTIADQHLLRFGEAQLPGIAGVLDAGERRCAGAAAVAGNDDVVGVGLGDAGGYGADAELGDQLDADRGARIDALEVVDELRQIFDGVDVVVRRRADELHAGLRVAQARDQLRDFVAGKLAAFAGLRALGDLDLELFGVHQVFGGDAEAAGGHLLDLVVEQVRRDVAADQVDVDVGLVDGGIFAALAGVRARAEHVHGRGDGLVRLGAQRSERHRAGDESPVRCSAGSTCSSGQRLRGSADFQQIAQHGGLFLRGLGGEGMPRRLRVRRRQQTPRGAADDWSAAASHGLRLPAMRLGLVRLAEANPSVVGQIFGAAMVTSGPPRRPVSGGSGRRDSARRATSRGCCASSSAKPMPPSGAGVPSKQRSTTSWLSPRQSKRCAPR